MDPSVALDLSLRRLSAVLCPQCHDIFDHEDIQLFDPEKRSVLLKSDGPYSSSDYERSTIQTHHDDISTMAYYAEHGCYICNIAWRHFFPEKTPQQYRSEPCFLRTDRRGNVVPHVFAGSGTHYILGKPDKALGQYSENVVELRIGLNSPISQDHHIAEYKSITLSPLEEELKANPNFDLHYPMRHPPNDQYDENTLQTVKSWLQKCRLSHTHCNRDLSITWYPTRLLDLHADVELDHVVSSFSSLRLQAALGGQVTGVRLIETSECRPTGPYIALTHRWQQHPGLQTTRDNFERMKQSIDEDDMPRVFQQAIVIARSLGIRYLWIDSLCIVQKDHADWMSEVKLMGKVYMHSYVTLSATAGGGKLFQKRDARLIHPCIRTPGWKGNWPRHYVVTDFRFWDERIYRAPTNTRCWITQERWLSPRVLHFAFDQLVWECRELDACETFFGGLPEETKRNRHTSFKQRHEIDRHIFNILGTAPGEIEASRIAEHHRLWRDWTKVLETYCRTETSVMRDRLLGLNLIGEQFSAGFDDELVAGLWRKTIPGDMLWHVVKSQRSNWLSNNFYGEATAQDLDSAILNPPARAITESVRPQRYNAPSWSWASVLGDIQPGEFLIPGRDEAMVDVLNVQLELHDPAEPILGLKSGSLELRGRLYPIHLRKRDSSWLPPETYLAGLPKTVYQPGFKGATSFECESHTVSLEPDQPVEYSDVENSCFLPVMLRRMPSTQVRGAYRHPGLEKQLRYIDERAEVEIVYGICIKSTMRRGEYRRLGRSRFSLEQSDLFVRGLRFWKKEGFTDQQDDHPTSLNADLYRENDLGVFTII